MSIALLFDLMFLDTKPRCLVSDPAIDGLERGLRAWQVWRVQMGVL